MESPELNATLCTGGGQCGTQCTDAAIPALVVEPPALLAAAAVVLLPALVATASLPRDDGFAGSARPAGVLVGGVLAWRRAPFVVVVLAAATTAAGLRLLGTP